MRTLNTLLAIRTSTMMNLLFYYIQKLPIIGKLIKLTFYANLDFKKAVSVIVLLFTQLWGVLLRFIYLGVIIYFPVLKLGAELSEADQLRQFIHIFTIISFVAAAISSATILEPKREKYIAVKLMRLSPTRYMLASLGYRYATFLIYLLPAMILFGTLLGATIIEAVLLSILITLWRILAEYAHLKLFERTGIVLIKQNGIVWSVLIVGYVAAYLPLILGKVVYTASFIMSLSVGIVIIAGGLFAANKLARYSGYLGVVDASTKRDDPLLDIGQMMTDAQKLSVKSKDSDYTVNLNQQEKLESKEGYAYLNAIFFLRHRSLISTPVNRRLAITVAFGVVGVMLMFLFRGQLQDQDWRLEMIFPFLALIMYFMSVGENICKAIFYNCDLSLMRYGFYRSAAYRHFLIRLGRMMSLNMLIAAALGVSLTAINVAIGGEWLSKELLMLWVCVISLSGFFTVHHLFMYYIFQPYSTEMNMKNPLHLIVNMVVSSSCGFSIILRIPIVPFTVTIFVVTLIYLVVALVIVQKYGRRTFRVK